MHALLTRLKERFPDTVLAVREEGPYKDLVAQVKPAAVPEIARFLHDDPEASFDMLSDMLAVDYPEDEDRFEVIYLLKSLPRNHRLRLKARLPEDDPTIPTVTTVWKGANFLERAMLIVAGFALVYTHLVSDIIGFGCIVAVVAMQWLRRAPLAA